MTRSGRYFNSEGLQRSWLSTHEDIQEVICEKVSSNQGSTAKYAFCPPPIILNSGGSHTPFPQSPRYINFSPASREGFKMAYKKDVVFCAASDNLHYLPNRTSHAQHDEPESPQGSREETRPAIAVLLLHVWRLTT